MKLKNYTKFFECNIERMHSGWVVWYSVAKNITLFDNLPLSWQICVSECSVQSLTQNCTTMGNYPLITDIAIRVSSFVAVILHEFLF